MGILYNPSLLKVQIRDIAVYEMDVDEALHAIGDFGRAQVLILIAVGTMSYMLPSWVNLGITFLAAFPDHFCTVPGGSRIEDYIPAVETNGELVYDSCTQYIDPGGFDNLTGPCLNGWTFARTTYGSTIVSEWDLVCERTQLAAVAQSVLILGIMIGAVIFGYVSDRIGRKPVLMFSLFCQGCLGIVLAFSPSYWFFLIIRLVMGIFHQGYVIPGYALISEFFPPKKRVIGFNLCGGFWPIGVMLLSLSAFFIRNWRYLQLAITLPFFALALICWFVPESPRWLVSVGKLQEAKTILTKLARFNGSTVKSVQISRKLSRDYGIDNKSFVNNESQKMSSHGHQETKEASSNASEISQHLDHFGFEASKKNEGTENNSKAKTSESSYLYLCKTPQMFLLTIVLTATWLVSSFSFHGLSLNSVRLAGNPYLNVALIGAIEIPANIVATTLSVKFGRRKPLFVLLIVSSIVCVVAGIIPGQSRIGLDLTPVILTFAVAGKFFVAASYIIVVLYAAEVFPTVVRTKGIAVGATTARIGPIIAPFVVLLDEVHRSLPIIIFGVASAIPSLFVLLLPETQGRRQPEKLEDIELMYREQKFRVKVHSSSRDDRGSP